MQSLLTCTTSHPLLTKQLIVAVSGQLCSLRRVIHSVACAGQTRQRTQYTMSTERRDNPLSSALKHRDAGDAAPWNVAGP